MIREFLDLAFGRLDLDWNEYVEIDARYFRPAEVDLLLGDATKARVKLGWTPKVTFPELVARMVDHDLELARDERALTESRGDTRKKTARWNIV